MQFSAFVSASAVACVALTHSIAAQSPAPRDTLAPAVVTATRVDVRTVAPTATTTVITGESLRARGITRVDDALRLVPGLAIVASGSTGAQTSLFLRGGNSNYVKVLVDGVALNDAGGAIDLANLTTDNIDRVEVVRGPASVLYGSDAVTGVVQLFTKPGGGHRRTYAELGAGSYGTFRADAGVSSGFSGGGYSFGVSRQSTTGVLPFNNNYVNDVLSASLHGANAATDARVSARWSAGDFHYPTNSAGVPEDHNAEQVDHRFIASADVGRKINDALELRLLVAQDEYLPRSNDGPDSPSDTLGFYGYYSRATHVHRTGELRLNVKFARSTFTLGAERAADREQSSSLSLSQYGPFPGGFAARRDNTGYYGQLVGDATDRLSYSVGARSDQNSAFGSFATARVSFAYLVSERVKARAAYGNSFKAPSFFENFATGYTVGNASLKPEQSRGGELGVDWYVSGDLTVGATFYAQKFADVIQYSGTPLYKNGPNYYNVAGATANGLEVESTWHAGASTTVAGSWSWLDSRVIDAGFDGGSGATYVKGGSLIRRPKHTIVASITQLVAGGTVQVTGRRVGEREDRDFNNFPATPVMLPAYTRIDASAALPIGNGFSAIIRADNLFGVKYEEVAHFPAPRAVLFAGLRLER